MQKKLITLAIAGLISAPAFAQSSVTLYGSIDFGYVSLGGNDRVVDGKRVKSRHAIDSGVSKANRLGFKGTEDLGNGLKAVFVLEEGLNGDHSGNNGMFKPTNRQSYAGLQGGFGTVTFGRQYTPQHLFTAAVDPFGKNGLGCSGDVLMQEARLNNLFAYTTPSFGGFKVIAGWSFNGTGAAGYGGGNEALENRNDVRTWVIAPTFTWDKLFVGANYHAAKVHRTLDPVSGRDRNLSALNIVDLYASYDFGFVKLGSTIGRRTTKKEVFATDEDIKITQWMVGATFRITPNDSILTSYAHASENEYNSGVNKARIGQWAIGYEHALSKRTVLYTQFATQSHNSAFKANEGFGSLVTDGAVGYVVDPVRGLGYRRGFAVGMRHDF